MSAIYYSSEEYLKKLKDAKRGIQAAVGELVYIRGDLRVSFDRNRDIEKSYMCQYDSCQMLDNKFLLKHNTNQAWIGKLEKIIEDNGQLFGLVGGGYRPLEYYVSINK
tara:strand:- start:10556 stop:10879 length:324 start_codon:yes stop_codon:yes gene_type:complete